SITISAPVISFVMVCSKSVTKSVTKVRPKRPSQVAVDRPIKKGRKAPSHTASSWVALATPGGVRPYPYDNNIAHLQVLIARKLRVYRGHSGWGQVVHRKNNPESG